MLPKLIAMLKVKHDLLGRSVRSRRLRNRRTVRTKIQTSSREGRASSIHSAEVSYFRLNRMSMAVSPMILRYSPFAKDRESFVFMCSPVNACCHQVVGSNPSERKCCVTLWHSSF